MRLQVIWEKKIINILSILETREHIFPNCNWAYLGIIVRIKARSFFFCREETVSPMPGRQNPGLRYRRFLGAPSLCACVLKGNRLPCQSSEMKQLLWKLPDEAAIWQVSGDTQAFLSDTNSLTHSDRVSRLLAHIWTFLLKSADLKHEQLTASRSANARSRHLAARCLFGRHLTTAHMIHHRVQLQLTAAHTTV